MLYRGAIFARQAAQNQAEGSGGMSKWSIGGIVLGIITAIGLLAWAGAVMHKLITGDKAARQSREDHHARVARNYLQASSGAPGTIAPKNRNFTSINSSTIAQKSTLVTMYVFNTTVANCSATMVYRGAILARQTQDEPEGRSGLSKWALGGIILGIIVAIGMLGWVGAVVCECVTGNGAAKESRADHAQRLAQRQNSGPEEHQAPEG
ncbi:hypothetical protein H2199_008501 [Coniosporium tulheliwenetii]|uniref:Uncharacterized protein n=1 Tax=Coniosporium tulheliwenetii TaxID=3383036 RepID=A0ACC2YJG2_9PEZI|nr:hypothetical protein H2199_008501 [Cladosporium sp. JES 115]